MESKLETLRGYYNPSFYKMHIEADCSLEDVALLSESHLSTYFHEYIHFLQDITTTFGLFNTSIIANRLKYYNALILETPEKEIIVPISLDNDDFVSINQKLQILNLGTNNYIQGHPEKVIKIVERDSDVWLPEPFNRFAKSVEIEADIDGEVSIHQFGAICIIESMTHIIQSAHFPKVIHNSFPYKTAELVVKFIYPELGEKQEIILAVCDISLMSNNPGAFFINLLIDLRTRSWQGEAKELYSLFHEYYSEGNNIAESFNKAIRNTGVDITSYFTSNSIFKEEINWIESLLSIAQSLRQDNPSFFLDLYNKGLEYFVFLFTKLGTPLVINISGEAWFRPPENCQRNVIQPDRLACIFNIFELFENGKIPCDLKSFCMDTLQVDDRCSQAPWSRSHDNSLCGFCQLWWSWGLLEKKPIKIN